MSLKNQPKKGTIGLWMYRNDGGEYIQDTLKAELEEKGYTIINDFDMRDCYCYDAEIFTKDGRNLSNLDLLFHMNADEQTPYQNEILKALEASGVPIIPNWQAFSLAKDKFSTNFILRKNGISVPSAILINKKQLEKQTKNLFEKWGKVLVKPRRNHGGKGIMLFDDSASLLDFVQATDGCFDNFYLEQFIPFGNQDVRVEIIQNEVIGGYSRKKTHLFKTNISSGGLLVHDAPPPEFQEIALRAAKLLNIETTIVDMIRSIDNGKIYILEVNPIMGLFVASEIRYGHKSSVKTMYQDFAKDDLKKLSKLIYLLDNTMKNKKSV